MLEYCSGAGDKITEKSAGDLLGASSAELLCKIATQISARDISAVLSAVADISASSRDIAVFWRELIAFFRNMLIYSSTRGAMKNDKFTAHASARFTVPKIMQLLGIFCSAEENMSHTPANARLFAEMALVRACDESLNTDTDALLARIASLEERVAALSAGGVAVMPVPMAEMMEEAPIPEMPPMPEEAPPADQMAAVIPAPPKAMAVKAEKVTAPVAVPEKKKATSRAVGLRGFADVVKKLEVSEPSIASFMIGSTAVDRDGKLYINLDNDFAVQMLSGDERKDSISLTIAEVLGKNYGKNDIIPINRDEGEEEYDAVDELV
jgi:DNA polymerase-3 subunit gamma/tau